ncbi:hypothetical protein HU200_006294 [Digitaria exilis]|uniref:Glycosyltransferase n=1 Tax=Digitaria exilis TaxID=1010633 RepID=A0A835FSG2_9POAL|nr:hypothetical protein HU200_006294 [Digitaria exilis]
MAPTEPAMAAPTTAPTPPSQPPHFILVPFVAQGDIIPLVDLALLLAERGARATVVTTPLNAARQRRVAEHAARRRVLLEFVELPFPPPGSVLPPDCQNADILTDVAQFIPFFFELRDLATPFDAYVPDDAAGDEEEEEKRYDVPGMPVPVTVTKATAPGFFNHPATLVLRDEAMETMRTADGMVVNTFVELEHQFVECYEKALGKPVWTLGPLSLCNRDAEAMATRGKTATVGKEAITAWLDGQAPGSVVYVSFGSIARKLPKQLFEVGHGLEDSGVPFLWVVKEHEVDASPEVREWLEALESRTAGRGHVARGWVPQLAVLSHLAVGGFVTHCGWNSLLVSIAHGVPVVTWPHFADQFINEQLAVDVLGVGVRVGVTSPVMLFGDEAVVVAREDVAKVVSALMGGGMEADERRKKAREYGEKARRAMEEGGSSYGNLTRLIESFSRPEPEVKEQLKLHG